MPTRMQRLINSRTGVNRNRGSARASRNRIRRNYLSRGYVPDNSRLGLTATRNSRGRMVYSTVRRGANDTGRMRIGFSATRTRSANRRQALPAAFLARRSRDT